MTALPREDYRSIELYGSHQTQVELDLSDNTNLWGTNPAIIDLMRSMSVEALARYPEVYADTLRDAVAERFNIGKECVTTGAGSDDLLDSAFRAAFSPGSVVSFPSPTFSMVSTLARMNGLEDHAVPWESALADPSLLLKSKPAVVYICRPNNPTGALAPEDWVERLLGLRGPGGPLVVLDEAYADFAGETMIRRGIQTPSLLVVRTTSKASGLAGIRCGFGVAKEEVVLEIEKSRGPYKVARFAMEAAATAVLDADEWTAQMVAKCVRNRERLWSEISKRDLQPLESRTNFILFAAPSGSAHDDALALRQDGVAIRPFSDIPIIGEGLRVTVGPWPLMTRFLNVLDRHLSLLADKEAS